MRVLFDQGTPAPLRAVLQPHDVETAHERGWSTMQNGELLQAAEAAGFDVLITTDLNLQHQQNLKQQSIAIIVLTTTSWPRIRAAAHSVAQAVDACATDRYIEVRIP
jgi:predicted nuclease of predicted toxin-antitoxin system